MRQQHPPVIIPILGVRTLAQAKDNLAALEFELGKEQLARLDRVSRIPLGFPQDFLREAEGYIFGKVRPLIDSHRR